MDHLVHPTLLLSIAFRLWQIYLPKIVRQCGQLSSSPPGNAVHLWWAMMIGWVIWVMKVNQNVKKVPLIIKKWKTHFYITFNFWWLAKWSKQQKSTEMQKKTQVIKKWNAWFWITFNFWWSAKWSEWWTLTETKKRPPNSLKNKMLIFGLCSISDDWLSNLSDERRPKCKKRKKGPWCHRKLKWSFLDYVQLLMIGQVINKSWLKCKKNP